MKNIIKTILVLGVLSFGSCDSELDLLPNNSITPDTFYKTKSDFDLATKGIGGAFFKTRYYGANGILSRPDILTDNVITAPKGRGTNQVIREWNYSPNSAWDMMTAPYIAINRANLIVNNIDNIDDSSDKNNYLGIAKASRALAMFDMLRVYSEIPTQSTNANTSLGMSINTGVAPDAQILRSNVNETYTWVIEELEAAKVLIGDNNPITIMNKNAVNALLSRVYLYNGEYQKSVDAANDVTSTVAPIGSVAGVWTDANSDGVIFKLTQVSADGISIGTDWSQTNASGKLIPEFVMSFELFNLYQTNDIRKTAYTSILEDVDSQSYNAIIKYYGQSGGSNGSVDAKIVRTAEVYLNKAESLAMLPGQDAAALTALDMVRQNRYSSFTSPSETGTALLAAIKLERRLELFAEGHYFFDLKRWNESITRSTTDGEFSDGTGSPIPVEFSTLSSGDFKFQMPIPQAEINVFPSLQQNPGY